MMTDMKQTLRTKILDMAGYIGMSHYVNNPNMLVEDHPLNDVVVYSLMTVLLNRNQLITGNYGLGKTTTAIAVSSLIYNLPSEFVERGMIQGHPQLTEEKIFGRLDFSKLNEDEKVIFSIFAQSPSAKIIDEINRLPPGTQNMLLRSVENGKFPYLNEAIVLPKMPFYATANDSDTGNTTLIPPLMDRLDVCVQVEFPMFHQAYIRGDVDMERLSAQQKGMIAKLKKSYEKQLFDAFQKGEVASFEKARLDYESKLDELLCLPRIYEMKAKLSDPDIASSMEDVVRSKAYPYDEKLAKLTELSSQFRQKLNGFSMSSEERQILPYILHTQHLEPDAALLLDSFFDHLNSGTAGSAQHNKNYAVGKVLNKPSIRASARSTLEYSRFLSFLKGEEDVSAQTVQEVLPYTINHRLEFSDSFLADVVTDDSTLQMAAAKSLVEGFVQDDFGANRETYKEMYNAVRGGDCDGFIDAHQSSDNPLIKRVIYFFQD